MEDTASSRHENRIAPAFSTLTKTQNNGFAEQLAFQTLVISWRKILESLELPESQTGPVVTVSLLHHPEPTGFPVNGGDGPACIFVS